MRLLIHFPTRERPEKFAAAIDNITANIHTDDYQILVSLDLDDKTMTTPGIKDFIKTYPQIKAVWGTSKGKIDAVNRDIWMIKKFDVLLVHSDDMWFTQMWFDDVIKAAFKGFKGLVHFPDQQAGRDLITYPMMHREYYERFGYVYNPEYWSVYADNEQHEVAKRLGKYKFVDKKILEHRHPIWGYGKVDPLLKRNEEPEAYRKDGLLFQERKAINFGI